PAIKRARQTTSAEKEKEKKKEGKGKGKGEPKKKAPGHHSALARAASAPASATTQETGASSDVPSLAEPAETARPKGLEIDMVAGTFLAPAAGGRGSRVRKRPARFEDGVDGDGDGDGGRGTKKARTA
ncbi:MAG: hypothetical protein Q9203_006477, partial [Teloschistes exilis]